MANPYVCTCDRSSAECSVCHSQDAWREGFEAGVEMAKLEAYVDVYHCSGGCCPPDYTIDWSAVDYALDKIKEEA